MICLRLDRHGWLVPGAGVRHAPSPNHDLRPAGVSPYLLVIHNISLPPGQFGGSFVEQLFSNRLDLTAHPWFAQLDGLRVSAHFFVRRDGEVVQCVSADARAWHAGVSRFAGHERCNDFSLGIELEGTDTQPYTDVQYTRLAELTRVLRERYPLRAVRGHEHIAPGRKSDPGPAFDWTRYLSETPWLAREAPLSAQA